MALHSLEKSCDRAFSTGDPGFVATSSGELGLCLWTNPQDIDDVRKAAVHLAEAYRYHFETCEYEALATIASNLALSLECLGDGARSLLADCNTWLCANHLGREETSRSAALRIEQGVQREGIDAVLVETDVAGWVGSVVRELEGRDVAI